LRKEQFFSSSFIGAVGEDNSSDESGRSRDDVLESLEDVDDEDGVFVNEQEDVGDFEEELDNFFVGKGEEVGKASVLKKKEEDDFRNNNRIVKDLDKDEDLEYLGDYSDLEDDEEDVSGDVFLEGDDLKEFEEKFLNNKDKVKGDSIDFAAFLSFLGDLEFSVKNNNKINGFKKKSFDKSIVRKYDDDSVDISNFPFKKWRSRKRKPYIEKMFSKRVKKKKSFRPLSLAELDDDVYFEKHFSKNVKIDRVKTFRMSPKEKLQAVKKGLKRIENRLKRKGINLDNKSKGFLE
jgi:hypothetical protein